jgi:DNA replication and repair protein RecF
MLQTVQLSNYRNLNLECSLEKANLLIAPNGSGKSNLLEAIYFSNYGRPFRTILNLEELIGPAESFARADFVWQSGELTLNISQTDKVERRFIVLGKRQKLSTIVGKRNVVLFAPTTINLVLGEPAVRRDDLDDYLGVLQPDYAIALEAYQNALKNRNAVIKMLADNKPAEREFAHFTKVLVEQAAIIYQIRTEFFINIAPYIATVGDKLFAADEGFSFTVSYLPNFTPEFDFATELQAKFAANAQKEIIVGKTLYGVHKDDYIFRSKTADLRYRGSRGQQRLAGLAFKLAQLHLLQQTNNAESLILLDDLMSELDSSHRHNCAHYLLEQATQFILTSAEESDVPVELIQATNKITLS